MPLTDLQASERAISAAQQHLAHHSPVMARLIDEHGPFRPRRSPDPDPFASLARAIIFQQLAGKAASSIHRRFVALLDGEVHPAAVLAADPEQIRAAGLSGAKRDAVLDLARHATEGLLDLTALDALNDADLTRRLCRVRGIGPWTAQMFLLFELGRLDVWPTGDLAVRRGFARAFELPEAPTSRELDPMGDPFRPHRSIVAWYCWRVLDTATPSR